MNVAANEFKYSLHKNGGNEGILGLHTTNNFPIDLGLHTKLDLFPDPVQACQSSQLFRATPHIKAEKFPNHGTTKFLYHDRLHFELEGVEVLIGYTHP